jgi:predicted lipoprotein with Yx(FWY)xxD motif
MKRLLILGMTVATALAVAIALTACGGVSYSSGSSAPPGGTGTVSIEQVGDAGPVLVDSAGRPLYASNQETAAGTVLCGEGCTSFWKPLIAGKAPVSGSLASELGTVRRPDGGRQVTFDHKLLYTFVEDQPGKVTGDGFEDSFGGRAFTWHVVHGDGSTGAAAGHETTTDSYGY